MQLKLLGGRLLSNLAVYKLMNLIFLILKAREEEMTEKVNELQKQLEKLQEEYQQRLADEESWNSGEVSCQT